MKMSAIEQALEMHEKWNGKIETTAKSHVNSREDLAIAYTPGVAEPCKVIAKDPDAAYKYTMKANTIAVVSDGSAVLGLGNIGAKAAIPVMEGKAVLLPRQGTFRSWRSARYMVSPVLKARVCKNTNFRPPAWLRRAYIFLG